MGLVIWNDLQKITENILDEYILEMFNDTIYSYQPEWTWTNQKILEVIKQHWNYLESQGYTYYEYKEEYFDILLIFVKIMKDHIGNYLPLDYETQEDFFTRVLDHLDISSSFLKRNLWYINSNKKYKLNYVDIEYLLNNNRLDITTLTDLYKTYNNSYILPDKPEFDQDYEYYKNQEYYQTEYYLPNESEYLLDLDNLDYLEDLLEIEALITETNDDELENQDPNVILLSDSDFCEFKSEVSEDEFNPILSATLAFVRSFEEPIIICSQNDVNHKILLSNYSMNEQNDSNSLFTEKTFIYLEKYQQDNALLSDYNNFKRHIQDPLNLLGDKVFKHLHKNIRNKIVNQQSYQLSTDEFSKNDLCYNLWFDQNASICFSICLRQNELFFHLFIKYQHIRELLVLQNSEIYSKILLNIFDKNKISSIRYHNYRDETSRMINTKNTDIESLMKILIFKEKEFNKTDKTKYNKLNYTNKIKFISYVYTAIASDDCLSSFLQEITLKIVEFIELLFPLILLIISDNPEKEIYQYLHIPTYPMENLTQDTYLEETTLNHHIKTLKRKKQIIFQGSPGTGKTYLAKHIAKHLTSSGDGFFELIQFHPTYSYEDFIQGIRPQTSPDGNLEYSLIPGRFLDFCKKAANCQDICILIIDEINRTNLSQVFGELMYLLEYREEEINLAGSNQPFKIPENVYIIGTMNTADRSIALVDHALRRRFAFITIKPNYEILRKYNEKHNPNFPTDNLIKILENLNQTINDPHYEIGVSFFLTPTLEADIQDIWTMEIEPYLEEYFFDETDKIDQFSWDKIKSKLGFNYDNQ